MGTLADKFRGLVIAGVVFAITFFIVFTIFCGETQRNYSRLLSAWNSPAITLTELRDVSASISQESQNEDLQFVARHLATTASFWSDLGYGRLGAIKASSKVEYFGRAFLEGYVNPTINLKTISLWWNAKAFEQASKSLDSRNKRMLSLRWAMSGGIAIVVFCLFGGNKTSRNKIERP